MKTAHIVEIYTDLERPGVNLTEEWVRWRHWLFHQLTLPSLLGQEWPDFHIVCICGQTHRDLTSSLEWHPRVHFVYDRGREFYSSLSTYDHIALTRIDSDDMLRKDAMAEVRDRVFPSVRGVLVWRQNITWSVIQRAIGPHIDPSPPYFTHIFPVEMLIKNWPVYMQMHAVMHMKSGAREPSAVELGHDRVCVVKHWANSMRLMKRQPPRIAPKDTKSIQEKALRTKLREYSVPEEMLNLAFSGGVPAYYAKNENRINASFADYPC